MKHLEVWLPIPGYNGEYVNEGVRPSDIARHLDKYWDLGDYYREWWETDDEGEWS